MKELVTIAIDAMGGDYGPKPIVEGLIQALYEKKFNAILVGNKEKILQYLPTSFRDKVAIHHCEDVINMHESASVALKRKDSSIYQAVELVRNKEADAVVSAGHSGATMAVSISRIGRLNNVKRPPLATLMPNIKLEHSLLLDVGIVVDATPQNLFEFAIMGKVYAKEVMGVSSPKIGLLSNGEEDSKGNELTKEAFKLLQKLDGFVGNVEGRDIFNGDVNVIVTDGFTGNVVLKTSEGVAKTITDFMRQEIEKSFSAKIGALFMKRKVFKRLRKRIDYAEYGGAPLLGIKGCSIVSHGSSNAKAIKNAIFQAIKFAHLDISHKIEETLDKYI